MDGEFNKIMERRVAQIFLGRHKRSERGGSSTKGYSLTLWRSSLRWQGIFIAMGDREGEQFLLMTKVSSVSCKSKLGHHHLVFIQMHELIFKKQLGAKGRNPYALEACRVGEISFGNHSRLAGDCKQNSNLPTGQVQST